MTRRERVQAAARGGELDRAAQFAWPSTEDCDLFIVAEVQNVSKTLAERGADQIVLCQVDSPVALAQRENVDLVSLVRNDPVAADPVVSEFFEMAAQFINQAFDHGADGIFYRVVGAEPTKLSPMEYGGLFLDRDQALLAGIEDARFNIVYADGGEGSYLDLVSSLPCHLFVWNEESAGVSSSEVQRFRIGCTAAGKLEGGRLKFTFGRTRNNEGSTRELINNGA